LRVDCQNIPFAVCGVAAVVVWQVMEYVETPEQVVIEAALVLRRGGVFLAGPFPSWSRSMEKHFTG
jgi:hypothetical protein